MAYSVFIECVCFFPDCSLILCGRFYIVYVLVAAGCTAFQRYPNGAAYSLILDGCGPLPGGSTSVNGLVLNTLDTLLSLCGGFPSTSKIELLPNGLFVV